VTLSLQNVDLLMPEFIMALGGMALLMLGVFTGDRTQRLVSTLAVALMLTTGAWIILNAGDGRLSAFGGAFQIDDFARFVKILALLGAVLVLIMSQNYVERRGMGQFEFPVLVVFAVLGMMLMISASDFLTLYMGLELQSLALYVLAAFRRDSIRSTEAGLKYFVLGALSSGIMLYGISLIYGFSGSTAFSDVAAAATGEGLSLGLVFGLVFLTAGLAFKISAVPFHMWTPDVYEGAPTPITAFFAASPKAAALALFVRCMISAFPDATEEWGQIIVFISILSMSLGAVAAIGQNNIKRLMAYSSIGHMGFALVGLAAGTEAGVEGVLIYLAIYVVTNIGVFVCILSMRRRGEMVENISDLAGIAKARPVFAFALAMLMFSLAGIPPLAGFFAKFYVFLAAIQTGLYPLAVIGVIASVVGAFYYLRIVKIMYFDEPAAALEPTMELRLAAILTASTAFTVLFVLFASLLEAPAEAAAASLFP
jgi:NADH-quinone oxidoreductase subunit N